MKQAKVYKLSKADEKMIGKKCSHCGERFQKTEFMDVRPNAPKEKSYYLWCCCLHPGDGILGSNIF